MKMLMVCLSRIYEMMSSYWPTLVAINNDPIVAEGMNNADKIVFSRTLKKVEWNNTRLMKDNIVEEIKKLKQMPGKDMTVLGSGSKHGRNGRGQLTAITQSLQPGDDYRPRTVWWLRPLPFPVFSC